MCTYILAEPYTLSMNGFASSGVNQRKKVLPVLTANVQETSLRLQPTSSKLQSIPAPLDQETIDWKIVGDWFLQGLCLKLQSVTRQAGLLLQRSSPVASVLELSEDLLFQQQLSSKNLCAKSGIPSPSLSYPNFQHYYCFCLGNKP